MAKVSSLVLVFALVLGVQLCSVLGQDWESMLGQASATTGLSEGALLDEAQKAIATGTAQKAAEEVLGDASAQKAAESVLGNVDSADLDKWVGEAKKASPAPPAEQKSAQEDFPDEEEEDQSPAEAPVEAPENAPVAAPEKAPVAAPKLAPVAARKLAPENAPIQAPSAAPKAQAPYAATPQA